MKLPKLFKQSTTGKIQEWEISTEDNVIIVVQGQENGKKQTYRETIKVGKNIGRSNETTPAQQAEAEAQAKWNKKHKKDYHINKVDCIQKTKRANIGGYLPMLAQSYAKHAEKHLIYPCYIQPKLDGIRCISTKTYKEGVQLWFRSGKEITAMGHITKELEIIMGNGEIFDGELYVHGEDFNTFTGTIRANKNLNPEITEKIKYHIYDFPRIDYLTENNSFQSRFCSAKSIALSSKYIKIVETITILNFDHAMLLYSKFIKEGYEGIMFRNINMPYEQKRSYNLLKYKEFVDEEFIIIGAEEGKGGLAGHVGSFICKMEDGKEYADIGGKTLVYTLEGDLRTEAKGKGTVSAKLKGKHGNLKHLFENSSEYMGKPLTITYQNLSKYIVPRFGIGKTIRFDK